MEEKDTCIFKEKELIKDFNNLESIREAGFIGFISVNNLFDDYSQIPDTQGIYLVIKTNNNKPAFVENGSGGFFKNKNPNVSIDVLKENWVNDTCVLYIGKAGGKATKSTLRKRIRQYLQLGHGKN